jgi:hypothetical protein
MKKVVTVLFAVALLFTTLTSSATALSGTPGIATGSWLGSGEIVPVDLTDTTYPAWLQLAADQGFKANFDQHVCHPFPGGQFAWVADIRVLSGNEWVSVPTTQGWEPDEEGTYMACADVSRWGGTYALFAWFDQTRVTTPAFDESVCSYDDWEIYSWWHSDIYPWPVGYSLEVYLGPVGEFPLGETVTYEILGVYPIPGFDIPRTGSTTSWDDGAVYATFTDFVYDELPDPSFTRLVKISTAGCTYTLLWDSDETFFNVN